MKIRSRALLLGALMLTTTSACGSAGGGTVVVGGNGPAGSGACDERLEQDSNGAESGIKIVSHRVEASVSYWCTGDVSPATYMITVIIVRGGVHGAGNKSTTIPTSEVSTLKVSTACSPGVYSAWYVVAGTWPGGLPITGGSGTPVTRTVSADEC